MGGSSRNRCSLDAAARWTIWAFLLLSCSRTTDPQRAERGESETTRTDTQEQLHGLERPIVLLERYPPYSGVQADITELCCRKIDSLFRAGRYHDVLGYEAELTNLLERSEGFTAADRRHFCTAAHQLTNAFMRLGGTGDGRELLDELVPRVERSLGPADTVAAETRALLAEVVDLDGDPAAAAPLFAASAEGMATLGHPDRACELHLAAAQAHHDAGDLEKAQAHFRSAEGLVWIADHRDTNHYAQARLAGMEWRPDSIGQTLRQVNGLLPGITDPLAIGYYHNPEGRELSSKGRNAAAYDQLLIASQTLDTLPRNTLYQGARLAAYLTNTAYCAKHAGKWSRCIDLASRSVRVYEQVLTTGDPFYTRKVLDGLCITLETFPLDSDLVRKHGDGVERAKKVLALRLSRTPRDPVLIAKNCRNVAAIYQEDGSLMTDSILKYATLCLSGPAEAERSSCHQLMAYALAYQGRSEEALHHLARGLDQHVINGPFRWENLEQAQFAEGVRATEILDDFARTLAVIEQQGYRRDERLLERFHRRQWEMAYELFLVEGMDISRLVNVRRKIQERSIDALWPQAGAVLSEAERDRVLAWMDDGRSMLFRRDRLLRSQSAQNALRAPLRPLMEARERLLLNGAAETDPEVLHVALQIDSVQQVIAASVPEQPMSVQPDADLARRIRASLSPHTALLEYQLSAEEVLIAVVRSAGIVLHRVPRTSAFNAALASFTDDTAFHGSGTSGLPDGLGPLGMLIPDDALANGTKELIIVPDADLNYLPFEVIPIDGTTGARTKQLIDHVSLRYALSASLLADTLRQPTDEEPTVLAFAPDYGDGDGTSGYFRSANVLLDSAQRSSAAPLLHNKREVNSIRSLVSATTYTGGDADEQRIKDLLGSGGVLHFAMHAYSSPDPMRSGLVIRAEEDASDGTRSAGDEPEMGDGVLHAFELLTHPVRSPLVVLSACESGHGTYESGEGVRSLARSFMLAGARNTVSSLWKVDDLATKEIMVKFYEHLAEGMGKADALAEAKRWYRRTYPNEPPSKWAAFVLIGDNEPVRLKKRSPVRPWMWVTGGLVLLLAGTVLWRRSWRLAA